MDKMTTSNVKTTNLYTMEYDLDIMTDNITDNVTVLPSNESVYTFTIGDITTTMTNINESKNESYDLIPDIRQPLYMIIIYCVAYGVVFLFALFGNIIVIAVVYRNRRMHTLTNFFIVNLAFADILVAVFCVPITLLQSLYYGWRFGAFMCKAVPYLQGVSVCASVNTLVAIAADRYLAICFTLGRKMTWRIAKFVVFVIWMLGFAIMIPWLLYYKQEIQVTHHQVFYFCVQDWPHKKGEFNFLLVVFIVCYVVPLVMIIVCYCMIAVKVWTRRAPGIFRYNNVIQKSKVRVIKMLALVVFLFGISWLPLYVLNFVWHSFTPMDMASRKAEILINICFPIAQWLGMSNSGINPIIYCFFSKAIRKRVVTMLACSKFPDFPRRQSRFSSTRFMSVDYTNGQITLRLNKRQPAPCLKQCNGNLLCESMFYD